MSELHYVQNGRTRSRPVQMAEEITLADLSENYEIVDRGDGYGIAVPIKFAATKDKEYKPPIDDQKSSQGATQYGTELRTDYNPEFQFPENITRYREMRMDAQVRSALRVAKSPVLAARWFMRPASDSPEDVERSEYLWNNLTRWMSTSWPQTLMEIMYMLDYGFYIFEKVFTQGDDGLVRWKKLAPIHPTEVVAPVYENDGGYKAVKVLVAQGDDVQEVEIEIERLLVFTYDKESGGMEGLSALRSVYKHWFIKENLLKIDAIQKERHSIGIPIVMLPVSYDRGDPHNGIPSPDVRRAHQIGRDLRGNESAHVVLPPNWELKFAKLEGNNVNPILSAEYHGRMIYENFLVNFMDTNPSTSHIGGHDETFMKGTRFTAEIIRDVINRYAIPQIYNWNWDIPETGYPELGVRRLGDTTDWRTISFATRNLVGAGIVTPDDALEEHFRDEMDFPQADPSTARDVATPQAGGQAKPPRQKPATKQQPDTPAANAGTDRSGSK